MGYYFFNITLKRLYLLQIKTAKTDNIAPALFAKTSKKSACLVAVNKPCKNSIPIPNKKENRNEINNGLTMDFN